MVPWAHFLWQRALLLHKGVRSPEANALNAWQEVAYCQSAGELERLWGDAPEAQRCRRQEACLRECQARFAWMETQVLSIAA